ncbi:hypothetical protein DM860_010227 [Cuscuta australis]|uniref:Uncharacterized protein n=1 Tax=Cuscuta australis TaxID=267555 RepID=A0A328DC24_9ASTE|nr:hypothetical protein DM860_010227 [Cuscuta australis]
MQDLCTSSPFTDLTNVNITTPFDRFNTTPSSSDKISARLSALSPTNDPRSCLTQMKRHKGIGSVKHAHVFQERWQITFRPRDRSSRDFAGLIFGPGLSFSQLGYRKDDPKPEQPLESIIYMSKSCKGLAMELDQNRPYRECAKETSPCISSECVGLRETYFNCKRGQVDMRARIRGNKGY